MAREISLTRGLVAVVDDGDFDWLSQWKWRAMRASTKGEKWYAYRTEWLPEQRCGRGLYMHRVIAQPSAELVVDHIDYDGLNNQRANLRVTTSALNVRAMRRPPGASGYRGVRPCKGRWHASFRLARHSDGRRPNVSLGSYDSPDEAARAYDRAALAQFGEFAVLNFPGEGLR